MTKLPRIEARRLLSALRKHGFVQVSQVGSHVKLRHADGRIVDVPMHTGKTLKLGTFGQDS